MVKFLIQIIDSINIIIFERSLITMGDFPLWKQKQTVSEGI